jgi:RING finger protein 113A
MSDSVVFKKRVRKGAPIAKSDVVDSTVDNEKNEIDDIKNDDAIVKRARATNGLISSSNNSNTTSKRTNNITNIVDSNESGLIDELTFASSRTAAPSGSRDAMATATYIIDGEVGERLEAEQRRAAVEAEAKAAGPLGDGVFRGAHGFAKFLPSNEKDKPKAARLGPQSASAYARVATVMDYAMMICKDWKERGVCGYGDNCIYLHDRTDYKSGWELERDFDAAQKAKLSGVPLPEEDDTPPFANAYPADKQQKAEPNKNDVADGMCPICKNELESPLEAKCGHRFCGKCVRKRIAKNKLNCAQCGLPTNGIFNAVKQ